MAYSIFRHKHLFIYLKYWDFDGDGALTWEDFNLMAEKYAVYQRRGKYEDDVIEKWKKIVAIWWESLSSKADVNKDGTVDFEEWLKFFDKLSATTKSYKELPEFLQNFLQLYFISLDYNKMAYSIFRHKHLFIYLKYWDFDGDGALTWEDFNLMAEKYAVYQRRGKYEDDVIEKWKKIVAIWWESLSSKADVNKDGTVDFEEWLKFFDKLSATTKSYKELPEFLQNFLQLYFISLDYNKMAYSIFRHKHLFIYLKYWDFDGDGALTWEDFNLMAEKYAVYQRRGKYEDDVIEKWKKIVAIWWESLSSKADVNKDGTVDFEEWLKFFDKLSATTKSYKELPEFLQNFLQLYFISLDYNKDGLFDIKDYRMYLANYDMDVTRSDECFYSMLSDEDKASGGKLGRERFNQLVYKFLMSKDSNCPSKYICGPFDSLAVNQLERKIKKN